MLILWENESENGAEYAFHPPRSVVTIFKFNGGALQALTCRPSPVESLFDRNILHSKVHATAPSDKDSLVNSLTQSTLTMGQIPGTIGLALHVNCDFYKEKRQWNYKQSFYAETEISTTTTLSELNQLLTETVAPIAGHTGKVTGVLSRLPGKKFNGNPIHLKAIETEDDLDHLKKVCKHSCVVDEDLFRVDVFVTFEALNIEEEFGEEVTQFLVKLSHDKVTQEKILAGLEELSQGEWGEDMLRLEGVPEELAADDASETCIELTQATTCPADAELPQDDTCTASLEEKIGAYRPPSAADASTDDHVDVQENEIPCVVVSRDEMADAVPDARSSEKEVTVPCAATSAKSDIMFDTMSKKKPRLRGLAKKVRTSKRALSKFFGRFSCFGTPSCLA